MNALLYDGIEPIAINEQGIQANYFASENSVKAPAVILLGGGQWGDYWGAEFAKQGFVGLSLPYTRLEGLPKSIEEVPLEYFENALHWLAKQPEVDSENVLLMGASRNAELALLVGSYFPKYVAGVIAYSPSSVTWSNTVLPYNSDEVKASWTYKGKAVPFVAMQKPKANSSDELNTLNYWSEAFHRTEDCAQAEIEVERINGPILMFSGKDDQVWPSTHMANQVIRRLRDYGKDPIEMRNFQYAGVGHLISTNPESLDEQRAGEITINGKVYPYPFGGSAEADLRAKQDARNRVFDLLYSLPHEEEYYQSLPAAEDL